MRLNTYLLQEYTRHTIISYYYIAIRKEVYMLSSEINVVKKKPLVLMIFPVLFLIEWLLSPFVINTSIEYFQMEYNKCCMGYYNINLLGTIFFTLAHTFTLVIICLVLMFFYKLFFLDKENTGIINNSKTKFLKVIVAVLSTYIFSLILFSPFFISYIIVLKINPRLYMSYDLSKYTIFLLSLFYIWVPVLFTSFLISHAVFCIQSGNGFKNTLKKSFKAILTKNSFIVLALSVIMALIYANIKSYQYSYIISGVYDISVRRAMLIAKFLVILIKTFSVGFVFMLSAIIVSKSSKNNIKDSIDTDMDLLF